MVSTIRKRRHVIAILPVTFTLLVLLSFSSNLSRNGCLVSAYNNYVSNGGNGYNNNYYNYNQNDDGNYQYNYNYDDATDDGNDDGNDGNQVNYNNDDYDDYFRNDDNGGGNDDANDGGNDDANVYNDGNAYDDDYYQHMSRSSSNNTDDGYTDDATASEAAQYRDTDDDVFRWDSYVGFDGVSVMPISCINYNNGQMIKFQLFDSENSYQCHFSEIATFVVSIAHYMRAYFNYEALVNGADFELPGDAGYLNCIQLQEAAYGGVQLYAKIGCVDRETFTSTKLQLHLYTDSQCSEPYDDGQTSKKHAQSGYDINGYIFPTRVSFRPPFYTCNTCSPQAISDTFNKQNNNWYDDDAISEAAKNKDENQDEDNDDDQSDGDDAYMSANDDVYMDDNHKVYTNYGYENIYNYNGNFDDYYAEDDDDGNGEGRRLGARIEVLEAAAPGQLEAYEDQFWEEVKLSRSQRILYEDNYDIGDWNMCQRIYKYGVWCDEDCRALDFFRTDQWSGPDIFLLSIMCTFVTAMMLLIVAKRLKAQQKARIYGDDQPMPGLPPLAMALIFIVIMGVIVSLSKLKFVNETLVFAVVTCILLFIYMLKLTLFETRRPVLLAAPRHDLFDSTMDERLFD